MVPFPLYLRHMTKSRESRVFTTLSEDELQATVIAVRDVPSEPLLSLVVSNQS